MEAATTLPKAAAIDGSSLNPQANQFIPEDVSLHSASDWLLSSLPSVVDTPSGSSLQPDLLSCVLFNARSLNRKLQERNSLLHSEQFDILCIIESWLHVSIDDIIILNGSNYSLHCADQFVSQRGGGVCVLLNNRRIKGIAIPLLSTFSHLELFVIDLLGDAKIRLFACYPPSRNNIDAEAIQFINELCAYRKSYAKYWIHHLVLWLEFPSTDWSAVNIRDCNRNTCRGNFLELCHNHGLYQFVDFPTRLNVKI
jgi:hypothetical protein